MSYGIIPYLTDINGFKKIWKSELNIAKRSIQNDLKGQLGFSFLPRETATKFLKKFNLEIKKNHSLPDFRAHNVMQDIFDGTIQYPTIPWVYSYMLEGIAFVLANGYYWQVTDDFKRLFPDKPTRKEDNRGPSQELIDYGYSRTMLYTGFSLRPHHLPNDLWYPCDLKILNYLPSGLPIPIPEAEDFPFISAIENSALDDVLKGVDFSNYDMKTKSQFQCWFKLAKQENRDLILFIY